MKIKFIILLMFPIICTAESINFMDTHRGLFKIHGLYGSLNTIIRTDQKQIETMGISGTVIESDILWTTDSTFLLLNRLTLKGNDSLSTITKKDTLFNQIVEANKYWHKVVSTVNGRMPKREISYFSVDTIGIYKDINELDKIKDYKGTSSGGTLVGYNYAVTFKQHSVDKNNFILAFLEGLPINEKSKFKMLDNVYFTMETNQKIAITNCRFNDKYDKEVVVIYNSTNPNEEAEIIKAWRFSTIKLRIEEVPIEKVKYKEADKKLINGMH